jgi:hypothetical protein
MEWSKQRAVDTPLEPYKHFVSGFVASVASNVITTPVDVVSQRQMVGGGAARYPSGLHVVRRIVAVGGVAGLYRGFVVSVLTYAPTSAVWWAVRARTAPPPPRCSPPPAPRPPAQAYGFVRPYPLAAAARALGGDGDALPVPVAAACFAACGAVAGLVSSAATNPLDVARTRLQAR